MLKQILQKYVDQQVKVVIFNSKSKSVRGWLLTLTQTTTSISGYVSLFLLCTTLEVMLVPSNTWGGQGLLGVSIRFCSFEGAAENVWHVLVSISLSLSLLFSHTHVHLMASYEFLYCYVDVCCVVFRVFIILVNPLHIYSIQYKVSSM